MLPTHIRVKRACGAVGRTREALVTDMRLVHYSTGYAHTRLSDCAHIRAREMPIRLCACIRVHVFSWRRLCLRVIERCSFATVFVVGCNHYFASHSTNGSRPFVTLPLQVYFHFLWLCGASDRSCALPLHKLSDWR
jgi:hypothetical protein